MSAAKNIDYTQVADVFWCLSGRRLAPKGSVRFRKFPSLDAAVRFVMGDKSEVRYLCTIDTDAAHYEASEIADLFARSDFPDDAVQPIARPSRRFGLDRLAGAKTTPAYAIHRDAEGTWTVSCAVTGEMVSINKVDMSRMSLSDAERMRDVLNGSDGQDMLAFGP